MKAKKGVVEFLNKVLMNELTAINQYFLHAEMCGNWGYTLLHNEMRKHAIDEKNMFNNLFRMFHFVPQANG